MARGNVSHTGNLLAGSSATCFVSAASVMALVGLANPFDAAGAILQTRYSPLHPANGEAVQFRIQAHDPAGITQIKLYVYEYAWNEVEWAVRRPGGKWGHQKTWPYPNKPTSRTETHTITGFPAQTFASFLFDVYAANGSITREWWGFTAGDWGFGVNVPVPLWMRPPASESGAIQVASTDTALTNRINVVFMSDYSDMLDDLDDIIFDGYLQKEAIVAGKPYWAFHYSLEPASTQGYGAETDFTLTDAQRNATNINANLGVILHRPEMRDYALGHFVGAEADLGHFGSLLHETGHGVFNLSDEYSGNGAYHSDTMYMWNNVFKDSKYCFNWAYYAGANTACYQLADGWFVPEWPNAGCIMNSSQVPVAQAKFGWYCRRRALWFYSTLSQP